MKLRPSNHSSPVLSSSTIHGSAAQQIYAVRLPEGILKALTSSEQRIVGSIRFDSDRMGGVLYFIFISRVKKLYLHLFLSWIFPYWPFRTYQELQLGSFSLTLGPINDKDCLTQHIVASKKDGVFAPMNTIEKSFSARINQSKPCVVHHQ